MRPSPSFQQSSTISPLLWQGKSSNPVSMSFTWTPMASISATESLAAWMCDSSAARCRRTRETSTKSPPERKILCLSSCIRPSIDSAAFLPSIARFNRDSSTGSNACASSRVKTFISNSSILRLNLQHPIQRHARPVLYIVTYLDAIDYAALDQILQGPCQVLRADAIHGSAQTAGVVQCDYLLALRRKLLRQAIHQMDFRSDCEHSALGGFGH